MGICWGRRGGRRDESREGLKPEGRRLVHFICQRMKISCRKSWKCFSSLFIHENSRLSSSRLSLLLLHQSVSLHHPSPSFSPSPPLPLSRQTVWSEFINFYCAGSFLRGPRLGIGFYGYQPVIRGETRWKDDCSSRAECRRLSRITHKFAIKCRIRIRSRSAGSDSLGNLFWCCRHRRFRARLSVRIRELNCSFESISACQRDAGSQLWSRAGIIQKYSQGWFLLEMFMLPRGWTLPTIQQQLSDTEVRVWFSVLITLVILLFYSYTHN